LSVVPDRDLVARSARLVGTAGYWGLVQLDFLPGPDGPALIDANPRYYPALALATGCGVNLPAAWHEVVAGAPSATPGPYRVGVSYRWLEADLVAALRGTPDRLLRRAGGPTTGAMWDAADPVPAALLAGLAVASRPAKRVSSLARVASPAGRVSRRGRFARDDSPHA
jgi:predicted ATP-grasp superfamily ATP-dependent carboligase